MLLNPDTTANLLSYLARASQAEQSALQQLSSGRRVTLPSDDPSAISSMIEDRGRMARNDQFVESIATVRDMMSVADSSLSSVVTALQRAITLGIEAANGTQSASNRKAIAADVAGITRQVLGIANTSYRGTFLFAGTSPTPAYEQDDSAPSGIRYAGNEHVNQVMVSESISLEINASGPQVFGPTGSDVFDALHTLKAALEANDTTAIEHAVSGVREAFDHITAARAKYGNGMQQLDSCSRFLDQEKLNLQTRENLLVAADPAKAATDLAQAQFAREATLQAVGRRSRLSLLDYLQ